MKHKEAPVHKILVKRLFAALGWNKFPRLRVSHSLFQSYIVGMSFPEPPLPRSRVKLAGKAIAINTATQTDYDVVDQWRSAHGYVINTFKVWLRRKIEHSNANVEFAQRLKRRNTVIDKLRRRNQENDPLIRDVTSMHDFAGCRLIFNNVDELTSFRKYILSPAVMDNVNHKLKHEDRDKYNYIERPKSTGYRGIHDVFLHVPRPHRRGDVKSKPWQGLMVEVQYRSRHQHAWATALEISDIMDRQRTKFGYAEDERGQFFAIASEIIARRHESIKRSFIELTDIVLERKFFELEKKLSILQRLSAVRRFEKFDQLRKHNILNIVQDSSGEYSLEVEVFRNAQDAISRANEIEEQSDSINAVYVTGEPTQLRSAYRNYFNDPVDFVNLLHK